MNTYEKPVLAEEEIQMEDIIALSGNENEDGNTDTNSVSQIFGGRAS